MDAQTEQTRGNGDWSEEARAGLEQAAAAFEELDTELRAFVRERPFVAVAAAVVGGFLIGRLLSRR